MSLPRHPHALLVALTLALLGCTQIDPVEESNTTESTSPATTRPTFDMTDFTIEQVADGPPLSWTLAFSDDSLQPGGMVNVAGVTYVFAEGSNGRGLRGWSSADGATWSDLGVILPQDAEAAVVTSGEDRIFVVTEGRAGGNPEVWSSQDGLDWVTDEIPIEPENELLAFSPSAFLTAGDLTIATGESEIDAAAVLEESIRDTVWPTYDIDRDGFDLHPTDETILVDLHGPAGLTLMTTTADELGIDTQAEQWLRTGSLSPVAEAWTFFEGGGWNKTTFEDAASVTSLGIAASGDIVAVGWTPLGLLALWRSFDGLIWEKVPYDVRPDAIGVWNDRLIGPGSSGSSDFLISDDGVEWIGTGLDNRFPRALNWHVPSFAASERGLVVVMEAFDTRNRVDESLEIPRMQKGDVEVLADPFSGQITVFEADEQYSWSAGPPVDSLVFDPLTETIHLLRPDGSDLVDVTVGEIDTLARDYGAVLGRFGLYHRALALTPDGESWTIWDLAPLGEHAEPTHLAIAGATAVVATTDHPTGTGFELWTAPLP